MSPSIPYVCPSTGKTKLKSFSDGITTLKKEHFIELLERRANHEKVQAEIESLKKQLSDRSDQVNDLVAKHDSATATIQKERNTIKKIQADYNNLAMSKDFHEQMSKSRAVALDNERKKNEQLTKINAQVIFDYNKIKASLDEENRKRLEQEKQMAKERKNHYSSSMLLCDEIVSMKKSQPKPVPRHEDQKSAYVPPKTRLVNAEELFVRRNLEPKTPNVQVSSRLSNVQPMSSEQKSGFLSSVRGNSQPKTSNVQMSSRLRKKYPKLLSNWDEMQKMLLGDESDYYSPDEELRGPSRARRSNDFGY